MVGLLGQVNSFPDTNTAQGKVISRKVYDPAAVTAATDEEIQQFAPGDGSSSLSSSDMVPASALVSIYLLSDVDFTTPIATVKTDAEGKYVILVSDVKSYLLGLNKIVANATEADILTAFRALGRLQVRAVVIKTDADGNKKALALQSIADPNSVDEMTGEPVSATVDPIVHQVVRAITEQIRASIESLRSLGLSEQSVATLSETVISLVVTEIERVLTEASDNVITIPEGQSQEDVIQSQEDQYEVVMDDATITAIEETLASDVVDEEATSTLAGQVSQAETKIPEEDSTTNDSLGSETQGLLAGLAATLNDNVQEEVSTAIETAQMDGNLGDLIAVGEDEGDAAAAIVAVQTEQQIQRRKALQRFFLSMGLAVVVNENQAGNASVLAISLPVPPHIGTGALPGGRGFGERSIRLFKIGAGNLDAGSEFTTDKMAVLGAPNVNGVPQPPLYYAEPIGDVVPRLLDGKTLPEMQALVNTAFAAISDPFANPTPDQFALVDRVKLYHDLNRRLADANVVSTVLINKLLEYNDSSVQVKRLASVIAQYFTWSREAVNLTPEGLPIFTGRSEPLTVNTVDSSEILKALTMTLGDSATSTAQLLTTKTAFYAQFAPQAVQANIERLRFLQGEDFDLQAALLDAYPADAARYQDMIVGTAASPGSPDYTSARDRVARGLTTAVPFSMYGTTITSDSSVNIRSALFLLDYVLKNDYLINPVNGYFKAITLKDAEDMDQARWAPNFDNYKFLSADDVAVSKLVSSLLSITPIDDGDLYRSVLSSIADGAGELPVLPEFKKQNLDDFANDLSARVNTVNATCTVQRYDGQDPATGQASTELTLKVFAQEYNPTTGKWTKGSPVMAQVESAAIPNSKPVRRTYTISGLSTQRESGYGRDYVVQFGISNYTTQLPELFLFADGYVPSLQLCPPNAPLMIGPDQTFVPLPGLGLLSDQVRVSPNGMNMGPEGIDLSNFEVPGAPIYLTAAEQTNGMGAVDFHFVSTESGVEIRGAANTDVGFAPVFGGYVDGVLTLTLDDVGPTVEPLFGLSSIIGANVRNLLAPLATDDSVLQTSIMIDRAGFQPNRVYLLRDSGGAFWLLELRFLDVFTDPKGAEKTFVDIGFARVNSLGAVTVPASAFNSTPTPTGPAAAGSVRFHKMAYGDWLVLSRPEGYTGPERLEPEELAFAVSEHYAQLEMANNGVFIRYAGEHFEENIGGHEDFETVFGSPGDYSSIPVRLDAGRDGIRFVKFGYDKLSRQYVMSPEPESAINLVANLKNNTLVAIFDDLADTDGPVYLARVVRDDSATNLNANFELSLEVVNFAELMDDEVSNDADVVCFDGSGPDCDSMLPKLVYSSALTVPVGVVYDRDFDGVPAVFDPNDQDPNIPMGSGPAVGGPAGGGSANGLQLTMLAQADEDGDAHQSVLVETRGMYPGDIQSVTLTSSLFGAMSAAQTVFTCSPPSVSGSGQYTDYSCTAGAVAGGITVTKRIEVGDRVGFTLAVPDDTLAGLGSRVDVTYKVTFRAPTDLQGNPFMCGTSPCPGLPASAGTVSLAVTEAPAVWTELTVTVGSEDPTSLAGLTSLDVNRNVIFSALPIPGAREYGLSVYCEGSAPGESYLPEENMQFFAPAKDFNGREVAPKFDLSLSWLGGRSCDFTLDAKLFNAVGEFTGISSLTVADVVVTGGGGSGGSFNNELKLTVGSEVCLINTASGAVQVATEGCTPEDTLFTVDSLMKPKATLNFGSSVEMASADGGRKDLTQGALAAQAVVEFNVDMEVLGEDGKPNSPTCGAVSSDPYSDTCGDDAISARTAFFVVNDAGTELQLVEGLMMPVAFTGPTTQAGNIPLTQGGFYQMVNSETNQPMLDIGVEVFTDANGQTRIWAAFAMNGGMTTYEAGGESTSFTVSAPGFMLVKSSGGQPVDFDLRYVRDGEMKVAWFLRRPQVELAGDHDIDGDMETDLTVSYTTGEWHFAFFNANSVRRFTPNGPQELTAAGDGSYSVIVAEMDGRADFGLQLNGRSYNVNASFKGMGSGDLEWFDFYDGGAGGGGGGGCTSCPTPIYEFPTIQGTNTLYNGPNGFNLEASGTPLVIIHVSVSSIDISLPQDAGSGVTLGRMDPVTQMYSEGTMFTLIRSLPNGGMYALDYHNDTGASYRLEFVDNGTGVQVRVYAHMGGGNGGGGETEPPRDSDDDSIVDHLDNCLAVSNVDQVDTNDNGLGDACDLMVSDVTGFYLARLAPHMGAQEYDQESDSCLAMAPRTIVFDITMLGNQLIMNVGEENSDGPLLAVMNDNDSFDIIPSENFQPMQGTFTLGEGFTFSFTDTTYKDSPVRCMGGGVITAEMATPVNEQSLLGMTSLNWFEGESWENGMGVEYNFEHGVLEANVPEVQNRFNFMTSMWEDRTEDALRREFFLTDAGVVNLDDIVQISGFGMSGEGFILQLTRDGILSDLVHYSADVGSFDVAGLPIRDLLEGDAFGDTLTEDAVFSAGAKLLVGKLSSDTSYYEFACDYQYSDTWFQSNLTCDNIVDVSLTPGSGQIPVPADSLADIVNMPSMDPNTFVGGLNIGGNGYDQSWVTGYWVTDDGTVNGDNGRVVLIKRRQNQMVPQRLGQVPATMDSVGMTPIMHFEIPPMIMQMLDDNDGSNRFVFVESGLDGGPMVRNGYINSGEEERGFRLFDDIAAGDVLSNFGPGNVEPMGDPVAGKTAYDARCTTCHGADGKLAVFSSALVPTKEVYTDIVTMQQLDLATKISQTMPTGQVGTCDTTCGEDIAAYLQKLSEPAAP
jgi:mono/diheme cytochrome c family protein